ncbi:MAG: glycosyltransferase [Rudaea sp.]
MEKKLLLSIIINNHNYEQFLKSAIDSALEQSYARVQVIVVDDGSTDGSREILSSYRDRVIPVLKENAGQASALNAGLARSDGDIVIFLDSDDVLLPDIGEQVVEAFRSQGDVAKVQYRMEVIDSCGERTGLIMPAAHLPFVGGDVRSSILAFPFDMTWMATSGNAFSATVLNKILPIPEKDFRILADFYLAHIAPLFGPVVALDRVGAYYRVHGANRFAAARPTLDLERIRLLLDYSGRTQVYIDKFACELGLSAERQREKQPRSVSLLANRLISYKLDPRGHPFPRDNAVRLCLMGVAACLRRSDLGPAMRLLLAGWFVSMACAPSSAARWLAEKFVFPETRGNFNRMLAALHRVEPQRH